MYARTRIRWATLLALFAALVICAGQGPADGPQKKEPDKAKGKLSEKKFRFQMTDVPWGKVLQWLADESGLEVIAQVIPQGSFTFTPLKGADGKAEEYTIIQVVDVLNRA